MPPDPVTGVAASAGRNRERRVLPALIVLTAVSGVVDAASYLGLGHVFTANMTGNVVILGFAAAGASGFSAGACLVSLAAFMSGAAAAGRLGPDRARTTLLMIAAAAELALIGVAAAIALAHHETVATGWTRPAVIALLAFAMGMRNAVVRRLAVPDMRTNVLTTTLTGLAADVAGGAASPNTGRRFAAVVTMFAGALVGAALYLHQGTGWALVAATCLVAVTLAFVVAGRGTPRR
jgi:uncharacterized membrane protein YoaK (UPF0700 family)